MKRTLITLGALAIGLSTMAATSTVNTKAVFIASKCNTCHSITSQGVAKTMAASKAPDLSKAGKAANAAALSTYLMKTTQINGKNHPKKWSGSPADLTALSAWLATLK